MTPEEQAAADAAAAAKAKADADAEKITVSIDHHKRVQREAQEWREKAEALEAKNAERERKELEDQKEFQKLAERESAARQKAEKERDALKAERQLERVERVAASIARELGLKDPSDLEVVDFSKIEFKDGEPDAEAIRAEIEKLKERKAHWFGDPEAEEDGALVRGRSYQTAAARESGRSVGKPDARAMTPQAFDDAWNKLGKA